MKKGWHYCYACCWLRACYPAVQTPRKSMIRRLSFQLGVDKGTEKPMKFPFSFQFWQRRIPPFRTIVCQAEGLSDGWPCSMPTRRTVDFTHLNFLVIGRTLAEEGVGQIIDPLMRMPQVRKGAMVIVAQDTAKKIGTIAAKR